MKALEFITLVARKALTGNRGSGIRSIPSAIEAEAKAGEILAILQQAGIPINQLDDYIRSEADVSKFLNIIKNANKPRVISGTSDEGKAITEKLFGKKGEVVEFPQKRSFKEEIEAMKKSGDIVNPDDLKKNDNVLTREMFQNSNLNKVARDRDRAIKAKARIEEKNKEPISEKFIDYTIQDINKKEPIEGMKIANKIIKREGEFKDLTEEQSKRILKETDDHLTGKDMDYDPEDFYAKGGRIGYQEGGGIESRLEQLGGDVTSAEQLLQQINERIQSAESNLGEGAGASIANPFTGLTPQQPAGGLGSLPRQMPIGQAPNMRGFGSDNQFNVTLPTTLKPAIPQPGTQPQLSIENYTPFAGETVGIPEQYKAGFDEFKKGKMMMGGQAISYSMLPDGNRVMFGDTGSAGVFSDYLKSIGAMPDNPFGPRQIAPNMTEQVTSLPGSALQSPLQQQQNLQTALPGLFAKGGRAGFYTGGIADVEPSLDDIGHGSDSLMARTRLMSPGNQATTSTGLNYLLAEDNDNLRVPFKVGGSGRRDFLKLLGILGGGIAGIKSGLFGMGGKEATKKVVTETVKQTAGSGTPPPYFFNLVNKIKTMGDDVTEKAATQEREIVTEFKDYRLTEDLATGRQTIQKTKLDSNEQYYDETLAEQTYMDYIPGKGQADEATGKVADEYIEDTSYLRTSGPQKGEVFDVVDGVPEDVIKEGTMFQDTMTEFGKTKKADGGRIGFAGGKLATFLADKTITGSSRKFLEKVFGKEKFARMIENDPELHRGMLEVVEMFRAKDKEGLKMYMQKFLPHMDDEMVEDFIVGSSGTEGIEGQLIRLGSGRDYKGKLDMMKEAENVRKLEDFDIDGVSKNADGGRIGFSGGGIFRAIIANSAKKKGMSPYEFIKVTNYKGLPPEVKMFISPQQYAELKLGQEKMYTNFIDMAKTRKNFQEQIEGGKNTPARELFEGMEKTMDEQSFVPKTVTSDDIAEMELMVKNRFNKGRKDNAQGGLQTMLGE
jgi:hypothetical protein